MANNFKTLQRKFKFVPSLTPKRLEHLHYMASNSTAKLTQDRDGWGITDWGLKDERYFTPLRWDTAEAMLPFMEEVDPKAHLYDHMYQLNPDAQLTAEWLAGELQRQAEDRHAAHDTFVQDNIQGGERVKAQLWKFIQASGDCYNDIVLDDSRYSPKLGYPEGGIFVSVTLDGVKYRVYVERNDD